MPCPRVATATDPLSVSEMHTPMPVSAPPRSAIVPDYDEDADDTDEESEEEEEEEEEDDDDDVEEAERMPLYGSAR